MTATCSINMAAGEAGLAGQSASGRNISGLLSRVWPHVSLTMWRPKEVSGIPNPFGHPSYTRGDVILIRAYSSDQVHRKKRPYGGCQSNMLSKQCQGLLMKTGQPNPRICHILRRWYPNDRIARESAGSFSRRIQNGHR